MLELSASRLNNMSRHLDVDGSQLFTRASNQISITPIIGWVCPKTGLMPFVKAGHTRMGGYDSANFQGLEDVASLHGGLFGFGLNYMATKNLILRGEYELSRLYGNGYNATFNAIKLGVIYKFDTGTF